MRDGGFHAAHKALTHHRAHGSPHEVEFEAGGDQVDAVHRAAHDHQGIGLAGVVHGFFQALGVFAAVFELKRVNGQDFLTDFVAAFTVQKGVQAGAGTDAQVVRAAGADVLVFFQVGFVEYRVAAGAFDPQAFGHRAAIGRVRVLDLWGKQFF